MKKFCIYFFGLVFSISIFSDDLNLGSDFVEGDQVSASAFNQRFNTITETIGRVKIDNLVGEWACTFAVTGQKGEFSKPSEDAFLYTQADTLTFADTSVSEDETLANPQSWTTDHSYGSLIEGSVSGSYSLFGDTIIFNGVDACCSSYPVSFIINMSSSTQFSLIAPSPNYSASYAFCNKN